MRTSSSTPRANKLDPGKDVEILSQRMTAKLGGRIPSCAKPTRTTASPCAWLERIEKWRRDPSLASPDGSVALEKM